MRPGDEREFVSARQPEWNRLTALLDRASRRGGLRNLTAEELRSLGPLHRRVATDLAAARSQEASAQTSAYLNALVARSTALLSRSESRRWRGLRPMLLVDFPCTFRRRLPFFLASFGAMAVGFIVAYVLVIGDRSAIDVFVPPGSGFRESLEHWTTGPTARSIGDSESAGFAGFLVTNNVKVSFAAFALGILGGLGTLWLIFTNGAMLGAFAAMMTHTQRHASFWPGIVPHGVVELSAICLAGAAGMSLGWAILSPGRHSRKDALTLAARDVVQLVPGVVALLIFAAIVEAFISPSTLPRVVKIVFGAFSALALYGFLASAGRGEDQSSERAFTSR